MIAKNIWFIGTGQFAAFCLEGMRKYDIPVSKIITGLPTRSGRNNRENPSTVELKANQLGLSVTRTGKLSENQELIHELESVKPEIIFVIDFDQIIREPFLSYMCLNIHPSLLPEYRGAAPIQRGLLDGKNYAGVSVFRLVKAMDAGDILTQAKIPVDENTYASDLYVKLSDLGCKITVEQLTETVPKTNTQRDEMQTEDVNTFSSSTSPALHFTPQDENNATYASKLEKNEFALSFSMSAEKFCNSVRALDMSGGAYVLVNNKRLKIWRVTLRKDLQASNPGKILNLDNNPVISCLDFCVELAEVQSEGKKKASGAEWSRGARLKLGDLL